MPQDIVNRKPISLVQNTPHIETLPQNIVIATSMLTVIQSNPMAVKQGDNISIELSDGAGNSVSKTFNLTPLVPTVVAFPIANAALANHPFNTVTMTCNVDIDVEFSAGINYQQGHVDLLRG